MYNSSGNIISKNTQPKPGNSQDKNINHKVDQDYTPWKRSSGNKDIKDQ
jgi:hypothetical protein